MASSAASPRFYGDDPVWREPDTQDASAMKPLDVDLLADLATNLVGSRTVAADRAKNVNTIDEVPDSSWYTNRAGAQPLTPADVFKGPDTTPGPDPASGPSRRPRATASRRGSPSRTPRGSSGS
jgi:hypothetical protein